MEPTNAEHLAAIKSYLRESGSYADKSVARLREEMEAASTRFPALPGIRIETQAIGHFIGEWVRDEEHVPESANAVVLYLHGGGFISGTCAFYRDMAARLAKASGVQVLTIEYRLAPEHPYPAAHEDCLTAYRWLREQGYPAHRIVLGGDSVGASLALMTLLSLKEAGELLPAGAFLLSPHTDLVNLDGESYRSRAELDPTGSLAASERILRDYMTGWSGDFPSLLSPLSMNLQGLPALLIQAGDHEVLLSDALRLAERAKAAGVDVSLEIWDNMWSVFQALAYMLPEAQQAISNVGRFVQEQLRIKQ
ncbi:alpha/beta hydrolase [Paenibacillus filicis]|uniref:Alpha/beta hydrolase n=1 Tax=Paenibacillus filicis TaxID=669464 RepID=A0ABU9DC58_9BACL